MSKILRRTGPLLYPKIVADKVRGPLGEQAPLRNQGTDLDWWLWLCPDIRPEAPANRGFARTRPMVPPIITSRMTLRNISELHVRYCPFLIGGDESVNGSVQQVIHYLNSYDCRKTNPKAVITIETTTDYRPPEYILYFKSGISFTLQEWSGATASEIIQALQRREYEETADCIARDEEIDTFHWDESFDQGLLHIPYVLEYHKNRPILSNFKKRLKAWKLIKK
eukprot:TRINITY_DN35065_c0_g1_i1.p1 TRINITY_DN35065_c0_g1~~TRINITY_DN35065_c0_g1_i1.p1  ORF type:complete len:238 (+),score=23.94 TRINITY_DN35065_c0_g1_i1:44-715(+)